MAAPSSLVSNVYSRILSILPGRINSAFAYGSAVFKQQNTTDIKDKMIDLVFVVDNSYLWHQENMKQNPSHYSGLRQGGPKLVSKVQEHFGAHVYYNTLIPFEDGLIKYGVINTEKFKTDLFDWETLYIAGRLHKPVLWVTEPESKEIKSALKLNLHNVIHTALLTLPEEFSEKSLFLTIAGLSYTGDFRMFFGEDKNKIENIVNPQLDEFRKLYAKNLEQIQFLEWNKNKRIFRQDCGMDARLYHLNLLPKSVQTHLLKTLNKDGRHRDLEDVIQAVAADWECGEIVLQGVKSIVWKSSWSQSFKGIFTAGLTKSVKYSAKKVKKMTLSMVKLR